MKTGEDQALPGYRTCPGCHYQVGFVVVIPCLVERWFEAMDRGVLDWVYELFPRLRERRKQLAGTLSGGGQQMLAISYNFV